jgi:hypothetical protein
MTNTALPPDAGCIRYIQRAAGVDGTGFFPFSMRKEQIR